MPSPSAKPWSRVPVPRAFYAAVVVVGEFDEVVAPRGVVRRRPVEPRRWASPGGCFEGPMNRGVMPAARSLVCKRHGRVGEEVAGLWRTAVPENAVFVFDITEYSGSNSAPR